MPKFLNHLDLNGNQLKNTKLEITDSPLAEEGVIHYHDTSNTVRYHDGQNFITLGDSDIATSSAAGIVKIFNDTDVTESGVSSITTTASRWYGVQLTENDKMVVNVPWSDTTIANTFRTVSVDTSGNGTVDETLTGAETLVLKKGSNITLAESGGVVTISSTDTNTQLSTTGVTGMALTGMVTSSTADVTATDTILAAIGKLEARTALNDDKVTNSQVSTDVTLATVSNNYLSISGQAITAGTVPVTLGGTGSTTAANARTALDVDQSGTDNSTPVTLVTTSHDYLTLSSQAITLGAIDATTDISGALPVDHGGTGQTTVSAAANALLNVSQGGALTIGDASDTITIAGNLTVEGTQTTIDSSTVATGDNMLELAKDNTGNATDFGWYGKFVDAGTKYAGMHWDASDTRFRLGYGDDVPAGTITWDNAGHLEVGKLTTTDLVIGGHTISDIDITSEDSGQDDHLMTAAAIVALIADNENSFSTATGVENNADVTDATNVAAAGAVMDGDFTANGLMKRTASGTYTVDTNTYSTATGVADNADVTPSWVPSVNPNYLTSVTTITGNAGSATVLAAGAVGGVKVFDLDNADADVVADQGASDSTIFTITHGMGSSRFYKVEVVLDSGDYDTVYVDVQRPLNTTIKITFGAAVANGAYRAMVTRMA